MTELSAYMFSALRDGPFTLYRGIGDGLTPILLVAPAGEYPSLGSLQRLDHEYALKAELDAAWAARPLALSRQNDRVRLVLEDPGGEPLDRLLGRPLDIAPFLRIAIPLTAAVGQVHARGLIHKDIKPANILVDTASGGVWLTGFGIASRLPREHQAPSPPEVIAGTLAYMAPEQTGRMNRSIDARSDLYALGVTLYQMLTGVLPFTAADPMEWVHCHIARKPAPPSERLENIPAPVSHIIMKLLAKTAEERYQTAVALERDLRRCLAEWEVQGRIDDFPLGEHDTPNRLLIPEQLYGRAREVEILLASFDRIVENGVPELVLVSGYSGIGKSAVVNELHKALVPRRGLFASGKFDQYKRNIPYATLAQAFQDLIRSLLGQSEAELAGWRDALREALGSNAKLMVDLVPELKLITGEPPPVPELPPQQAQSRFQLVFRRLLGVFARPDHPLALFLDDLQWLDPATLDLLEDLLTQPEVRHLLLIGAYRDNEVDAAHPLARKLKTIRQAKAHVQEISLAPLARADIQQLITDALRCGPAQSAPLAQLVHEKTGGNPFFIIQFLNALADEDLLTFDHDAARWCWDIDRIYAEGYTDNVVDLMVGKLTRLPIETQTALQQLACLGNVAEIATLCLIRGTSEQAVHADLWEAVRQELILHLEGAYKFVHDRVQEASYSLIPADLRAVSHLRIGRLVAAHTPPEKREEAIFEIVNQLNRGAALITAQDEREQLAELDLIAGTRAKLSTAYASALTYLVAGAALLPEDAWERRYELAFALELDRAECEFLTGALAEAEQRLAALSTRATTTVERAKVACLRVDLYTTLDQSSRAFAVGLDYLRHLGIDWSPHPTEEEARREYERIWSQLGSRTIESLIELPLMSDPASLATLDVLAKIMVPAMYTDANLLALVTCRTVNLSLERGNCDASCAAYAFVGIIAGGRFGDYQAALRFGQLGYDLIEGRGLTRFQARTYIVFGNVILPWMKHVRDGRDLMRRAFEAANKIGDLTYAAYACYMMITNLLAAGDPLVEVQREAEAGLAFAQKAQFGFVIDCIATQLGLIHTLRGLTPTFGSFNDEQFDELRIESRFSENPDLTFVECWYWIRKLQARFLAGDYGPAIEASSRAQRLLWVSVSPLETAEYHFYRALSVAASCDSIAVDQHAPHLGALATHHRQLEIWAANCPENFENRAALVGAEIARLESRELDAERLYEQAIRSARANGFIHQEALANELAARFYAARGFEKIARVYLRDARYGYLRWGADGKVRQLDEMYPHFIEEEPAPASTGTIGAPVEHLDLATVIKVSQAVSGEIVLGRLIQTLMTIALEDAGADRGLLFLLRGDTLQIEAEAKTDRKSVEVTLRQETLIPAERPVSILHTVIRTQQSLILDDASVQNPFSADDYVRQKRAKSILCLPLVRQGQLIGVLYLENSLASYVFTPARIAVLRLLSSQAAISLDHARLYSDLINENRDRQKAEDALRASEERWRSLFENVPVGVALIGSHGRYVAANPAFQQMLGYSEAELLSRSAADITHEDDRAATEARFAGRAAGDLTIHRVEKRYRRRNGGVIWAEVSAFQVPIVGNIPLFAAVVVDVTDRRRAEDDLRRSEASLTEAQQISHTGSWRWTVGTGKLVWSAEHFRIFALDPATTQPSDVTFMQRLHAEDRPAFDQAIRRAVRQRCRFQHEYRIVLPDGSVKHLQTVGQPDITESGDLEFVGTVMDITERRRADEALRNTQAELARVARLTTMGELVASIAHEINQPLAAVTTNADACLRWLNREKPDLDEARDAVERIQQGSNQAGNVIRGLRALARKSGPELARFDINDAIREVLALVRTELQRQGVVLHTDLTLEQRPVLGDRVQLQQVLLNLMINGIEAMSTVTERTRELTVSSALEEPGTVLVAVEDTGTGLDEAIAQRIFEPFFTTKSDGLGMGLSICRSIVQAHGGQLWVPPRAPHGTALHFTIPIAVEV